MPAWSSSRLSRNACASALLVVFAISIVARIARGRYTGQVLARPKRARAEAVEGRALQWEVMVVRRFVVTVRRTRTGVPHRPIRAEDRAHAGGSQWEIGLTPVDPSERSAARRSIPAGDRPHAGGSQWEIGLTPVDPSERSAARRPIPAGDRPHAGRSGAWEPFACAERRPGFPGHSCDRQRGNFACAASSQVYTTPENAGVGVTLPALARRKPRRGGPITDTIVGRARSIHTDRRGAHPRVRLRPATTI
jgi:hypothetical protein